MKTKKISWPVLLAILLLSSPLFVFAQAKGTKAPATAPKAASKAPTAKSAKVPDAAPTQAEAPKPQSIYRERKVDPALADQKSVALGELRSGTSGANIDKFMMGYYIARWTVLENAKDLHKYREELCADFVAFPASAKKNFYDTVLKYLKVFAEHKMVYPACRYNMVLALGELNETPGNAQTPPVPYAGALDDLISFVNTSEKDLPDYVRLAALIGVVRHAELGIKNEQEKNKALALFLDILGSKYAIDKKLRKEIHIWFKVKALEAIYFMKSPKGAKGPTEILDALRQIMENKNEDSEVRSLTARSIGNMNLSDTKKYDYLALAHSIAHLALNITNDELKYIGTENLRDQIKGNSAPVGGMGSGPGEMGSEMGDPMMGGMGAAPSMSAQSVEKVRNIIGRIKFDFESVQNAISGPDGKSGIKLHLNDQQKDVAKLLDDILVEISDLNDFLDNGKKDPSGNAAPARKTSKRGKRGKKTGPDPPKVTIPEIKDYLDEMQIRLKELLNIETN